MRLRKYLIAGVATAIFAMPTIASADIVFDFREDTDGAGEIDQSASFDGGNGSGAGTVGSSFLGFDDLDLDNGFDAGEPTSTISVSIVDIIGQNGSRNSTGSAHTTNVSGQDALSINDDGTGSTGGGGDSSHFNAGEGVDLSFNQDVFLTNVELESFTAGETVFTVSTVDPVTGVATSVNLADSFNSLGQSFLLAANQTFTFSFDSTTGDDQVRLESFQVVAAPPVVPVVPEPSSLALLGLGAIGLITRRKRA